MTAEGRQTIRFHQEGQAAHADGTGVWKCPYLDDDRRAAWRLGWFLAERAANSGAHTPSVSVSDPAYNAS